MGGVANISHIHPDCKEHPEAPPQTLFFLCTECGPLGLV